MGIGVRRIAVATLVIAGVASMVGSAQAQHWHHGGGWGPGAGFVGGLAVGSAIGAGPYYRSYAYEGDCYIQRRVVINRFGDRIVRRVRVCD
jgi:hypothetical protein